MLASLRICHPDAGKHSVSRCQFWCQLVLPDGSLVGVALHRRKLMEPSWIQGFFVIRLLAAWRCAPARKGLVGINSAVSYRLDHAPADLEPSIESMRVRTLVGARHKHKEDN